MSDTSIVAQRHMARALAKLYEIQPIDSIPVRQLLANIMLNRDFHERVGTQLKSALLDYAQQLKDEQEVKQLAGRYLEGTETHPVLDAASAVFRVKGARERVRKEVGENMAGRVERNLARHVAGIVIAQRRVLDSLEEKNLIIQAGKAEQKSVVLTPPHIQRLKRYGQA